MRGTRRWVSRVRRALHGRSRTGGEPVEPTGVGPTSGTKPRERSEEPADVRAEPDTESRTGPVADAAPVPVAPSTTLAESEPALTARPENDFPEPESRTRTEPPPFPAPPDSAPVPVPTTDPTDPTDPTDHLAPPGARPRRAVGLDRQVAEQILSVGDKVASAALRRRLGAALAALPDIGIVMPDPGTPFDPDLHVWASGRPAPTPSDVGTVAETLAPGLTDHLGRVIRPARVSVHHEPKEAT
ncbi:hypothetical protein ACFRCG_37335 [Embleya sp. NPDC056575]|uniref:hypothetical protein n=1 Tax=unclassified Embleya TaxID=2699296 RepID=UPI0036D0C9F9